MPGLYSAMGWGYTAETTAGHAASALRQIGTSPPGDTVPDDRFARGRPRFWTEGPAHCDSMQHDGERPISDRSGAEFGPSVPRSSTDGIGARAEGRLRGPAAWTIVAAVAARAAWADFALMSPCAVVPLELL